MMIPCAAVVAVAMAASGPISLFTAGKYSDALREGKAAVEHEPSSAAAHYQYGVVLRNVYRRAEAVRELERARQLAPADRAIAVELGWALAELGELDRARAIAAELAQSSAADAADLEAWLAREVRFRAGPKASFPAGSPSAFVAQVMDKLSRHRIRDVLEEDVDRSVLDRWAADSGSPSATATDEFVSGIAGGIEGALAARAAGLRLIGYEVAGVGAERAGRTYVTVDLLVESRSTPEQRAVLEKAVADPSLGVPMDPTMAKVLRGLDPADRALSLTALSASDTTSDLALEFELAAAAAGWKITDVSENDSGLRLSRLVEMTRTLGRHGVIDLPEPRRHGRAYQIGYAVGQLVGVVLVIAFFIWLLRRSRRRRRR
jgi:tetratricopeptide (TPR) repeat protein